ncbi:MAG: ComEC/Rec2 family competence protein [Aquificae bacterium]|nr:ComEC/Rec2 family competence protein [Aquificota bacterium]
MPARNLLIHLLVFILASVFAYWDARLPQLYEHYVYMKLEVLGQWEVSDTGAGAPVIVEESEFPEIEGRRAYLFIRRGYEPPSSRRIEVLGTLRVRGNSIFITTFPWEVEELPPKNTLRERLIERFKGVVREPHLRAMGLAFLFGESRRDLPLEVERAFLHTGLIHVLVVSGLHVGLVYLILSRPFPPFVGAIVGSVGVLFYFFFIVPHNPPVIRATIMVILWALSFLSFRQYCSLCALFFSSSVILLFWSHFFYSYSLWLSFFAVLYIILSIRGLEVNNVVKSFIASFGAFTGTAPLVATFSFISPLSVLLTPLLSPLIISYALFAVISLVTAFSFPPSVVFMNLSGQMMFLILEKLSEVSPKLVSGITPLEAFGVLTVGAIFMYFLRGYYRLLVLLGIQVYLILR